MADTKRVLSALQTLLADNSTQQITAQRVRDFLVSTYGTWPKKDVVFTDSPYTPSADHVVHCVDASGGNVIIDLPDPGVQTNAIIIIEKEDGTANTVTINATGGDTVVGDCPGESFTSIVLYQQNMKVFLVKDEADEWTTIRLLETEERTSNIFGTGLLDGGIITITSGETAKFDLSAGEGFIINNHTNPLRPTRKHVKWTTFTNQIITNLATQDETTIMINSSGAIVQQASTWVDADRRDYIVIGTIGHTSRTDIDYIIIEPEWLPDLHQQMTDFIENFGQFNIDGNVIGPNGANLKLDKNSGHTFDNGANYAVNKKAPNIITDPPLTALEFIYYHRNGAGAWVNNNAAVDVIDPSQYDTAAGLVPVTTGYWTVQALFYYSPVLSEIDIQYGQAEYSSKAEAKSSISETFLINPFLKWNTFRGWLVVKKGATALNGADAEFVQAGKFGLVDIQGAASGGEINTASNLGVATYGLYKQKLGVDLQFKSITASSNKVTLTANTDDVGINIAEANVVHQNLSGAGTNAHSAIDSHIASASNPHAVTKAQVSLTNVTDDSQLKRAAGDYATFAEKTVPDDADLLLIEDSGAAGAKKKMQLVNSVPRIKDSVQGLVASSNVATPLSKVDIALGGCRSDDNATNLDLVSALTGIDITASGLNGLDSGSEETSQWYAIWLIYNPTTKVYGGLLSLVPRRVATNNPAAGSGVAINIANTKGFYVGQTVVVGVAATYEICIVQSIVINTSITVTTLANSYTTPFIRPTNMFGETVVMPSGYTKKRRVGFVRNNASSNFIPFTYIGQGNHRRYFYRSAWATDRFPLAGGGTTGWVGIHCSDYASPGANVIGLVTQGSTGAASHSLRPFPQTIETQRSLGAAAQHMSMEALYCIIELIRNNATTVDVYVENFEEDL